MEKWKFVLFLGSEMMKKTNIWTVCWISMIVTCIMVLVSWKFQIGWDGEFAVIILIIINVSMIFYLLIRHHAVQQKNLLQSLQLSTLQLIHHQRHDWINDLQLLYGYIRLQKYDRLLGCVETIKERMEEESRIARLGIPDLVIYLMQQRISKEAMPLCVSIPQAIEWNQLDLTLDAPSFTAMVKETVQVFRLASKREIDDYCPLHVTLLREVNQLSIRYELKHTLLQSDEIMKQLNRIVLHYGLSLPVALKSMDEDEVYHIVVPYRA